jgi:hypothetical protein
MATGREIRRLRGKVPAAKVAALIGVNVDRLRKWEERDSDPKDTGDAKKVEDYFGVELSGLAKLDNFDFFSRGTSTMSKPTEGSSQPTGNMDNMALEKAILNLSESDKVNARNIERLINLLEIKFGVGPYLDLPSKGQSHTIPIDRKQETKETKSGSEKGSRTRSG